MNGNWVGIDLGFSLDILSAVAKEFALTAVLKPGQMMTPDKYPCRGVMSPATIPQLK